MRRIVTLLFLVGLWAGPALAQGCAMCYSNAAGSSKDGQRAISRGVLVLLIPPVGMMTLGVGLAFRYGTRRDNEGAAEGDACDACRDEARVAK